MSIKTDISVGEFLDKLSIVQIKRARISDDAKLININKELEVLHDLWRRSEYVNTDLSAEREELRLVNELLWDIEDDIREKEARGEFDSEFIELARAVYVTNDRRAKIKKSINTKLGSGIVEEKSYKDY